MTNAEIIDAIVAREGGFVDNPADKGGPTKYGITLPTLSRDLGRAATVADLQALTIDDAKRIYGYLYLQAPGYNLIADDDLRGIVVDAAVNHGTAVASKMLQRVAGVVQDGVIGPVTLAAVNGTDGRTLARRFLAERARLYGRIIAFSPSQATFAHGWMNRLADLLDSVA